MIFITITFRIKWAIGAFHNTHRVLLMYHIHYEDIYKHKKADIHEFDTSDYPLDNVYGIPLANKKSLVSWEMKTTVKLFMLESVGMKSKMSTIRLFCSSCERQA